MTPFSIIKRKRISIVVKNKLRRIATLGESYPIPQHCGSRDKDDFDCARFIANINALGVKRPTTKFRLIVRRDRNISRGTGTLLSPNDRLLGDKYPNDVVLTLYRVNGSIDKGWNGQPLWIPNIKFPEGLCFYDSESSV